MIRRRNHRKQHTVPKTYLDNFTDKSGSLWILNTSLKIYRNAPQNTLTKDYFYDVTIQGKKSLIVEKGFLGTLEGKFARIYRDKISKKLPLTDEEKVMMSIFIAAQMGRVPGLRNVWLDLINRVEEMTKPFMDSSEEERKAMSAYSSPIPSSDDSIPVSELISMRDTINSDASAILPELSISLARYIFSMNWGFMVYEKGDNYYITSDDPCTMVNPELEKAYGPNHFYSHAGLAQKGVEVMIPLSPTVSLLCGYILKHDQSYIPVTSEMVNNANQRHLRHGSLIITHSEQVAKAVKNHILRRRKLYEVRNVLAKPLADIHIPIIQGGDLD